METQIPKAVWGVLALLIAVTASLLFACLVIDLKTAYQADVIKTTNTVTLHAFEVIVGAVIGALGTAVGMTRTVSAPQKP